MIRAALLLVLAIMVSPAIGQYNLSGVVVDEQNTPLPGANLFIKELSRGTVTYEDGSFSMGKVPEGSYHLKVTFVGYETQLKSIHLSSDMALGVIQLTRAAIMGEEVIVTATRAGSKTPVAFSDMDREEITSRNFGQDMPYLLASTPSVVTSSDAGHGIGYTSMRIRGTDSNRINVTINGVPLNDAESHSVYWVDLPDIATSVDNIQIQRGVGTSTNGAAAFGASVNFQTQKLNKEPYAMYDGTVGSFKTMRNSISAGTGLIKEHFAVEMRLSDLRSDGYMDRSWTNLNSYYASAGYHDLKTLIKFITFSGTEELYQAWNGVPSSLLDSLRTYNELGAYTDADGNIAYYDNQIDHYRQTHYQLHLSRVLNDRLHVNAALHYTKGAGYYEQYKEDESLSDYLLGDVIIGVDTIGETDLIRRKWLDNDFYGIVGGLHYQTTRFNAIMGGGWNRYAGDHFGTVIWARNAGEAEIRHHWYDNTGIKTDWNSYLKSTLEAGDRISLFADLQVRGIAYGIEGADDDLRDISQEHHYLFFNPKAGINFELNQRQRAYIFVARANREPNRSNFVDADPNGPLPVKETLIDYEAGYALQERNYNLNANFYYMDYTDQLVLTGEINDVGSAVMTNVRDSYRAGIELSGRVRLTSWFRWDLNATLSRNKIVNFRGYVDNWDYWSDPDNEPYQVEEELGSTDLSFSPALILNNHLDFQPVQHLHLNLISRFVGKQYIDNTSSEERILDPYFINDVRISYAFYPTFMEEISLQLQVSNLFNVEYETNAWVYRYYYEGSEGIYDGFYPQAGTHLMAGIRLRF
ncbi:MAG: TonB-dependent receptor [Bacteroidota bacterium]